MIQPQNPQYQRRSRKMATHKHQQNLSLNKNPILDREQRDAPRKANNEAAEITFKQILKDINSKIFSSPPFSEKKTLPNKKRMPNTFFLRKNQKN